MAATLPTNNNPRDLHEARQIIQNLLFALGGHTHVKSEITDLETITTTPTAGAIPKADGSGDIDKGWLPATIDANGRVAVSKNSGATVGTRRRVNFIEGANVTLTITDDNGNEEVDITIACPTPYTDEMAQDAVGGILSDSTRINFSYTDGTPEITADLIANTITAGYLSATATDKIFGRSSSGAGAGEEITCTAFGRSLIDDANAGAVMTTLGMSANGQSLVTAADYAAMRALLDLEIGTDVQAYDADLTTWAGLTPSANAQSLVTAANYAAMRALLDLEAGTDFYSKTAADAAFAAITHATLHGAGGSDQILSLFLSNTGLKVVDTNSSHGLIFKPGSDLTADRTWTITTGDADRTLTLSGNLTVSGNATLPAGTALVTTDIGVSVAAQSHASQHEAGGSDAIDSIYFSNTGCKIVDTNASHGLTIKPGSDLTADRIFTLTTGDAARTLTINGDTTLGGGSHSGTNTGDEAAASDTVAGKIEIAVQSEMEAASDTGRAVTPGRLEFHPAALKAWAYFNGTGTPAYNSSHRGNTITDNGTGNYTLNWSITFSATASMCCMVCCGNGCATTAPASTTGTTVLTFNTAFAAVDATHAFCMMAGDR